MKKHLVRMVLALTITMVIVPAVIANMKGQVSNGTVITKTDPEW